jgi:hypothetical protein
VLLAAYVAAIRKRQIRGNDLVTAILDSAALLFVVLHFSFLVWVFGHLTTLQSAEKKYEEAAARFNAEAREVQAGNVEIARTAERIAQETTKRARLENDTAYQQRRAAEAGGILRSGSRPSGSTSVARSGDALALATAPVELERPTKPAESSVAFLTKLDAVIRLANLAEWLNTTKHGLRTGLAVAGESFRESRKPQIAKPDA